MRNGCPARHRSARGGYCLGIGGRGGDHYAFHLVPPGYKFRWANEAEADKPNMFLTAEEISILLTALQPIKQFFPALEQKLTTAKESAA